MKNLQELASKIKTSVFDIKTEIDGTEKWSQTERNSTRAQILMALKNDLIEAGFEAYRVDKGVAVVLPNDELGSISFVLAPTMSDLDADPQGDAEEWEQKQQRKAEKAAARAAKSKKKEG